MQKFIIFAVVFLFSFVACELPKKVESLEIESEDIQIEKDDYILIDLLDLPLSALASLREMVIKQDHSQQKVSKYEGYPLHPVLDYIVDSLSLDIDQVVFTFQCDDGYLATTTLKDLYSREDGLIAVNDLDITGANWSEEMNAKYPPFYLVWEDIPYGNHEMVWPYGWSKIRIRKSDPYMSLAPQDSPELLAGFTHYKTHCIKCHAINKIGGEMGPDFNYPKNITTYWQREHIISYAQNPSSYRWNTKMYNIDLSEEELDEVVDYLSYMQEVTLIEE